MKRPNEKKQDLLLDALSCIDEDILERGLALRDGIAAPAPKAAEPAPTASRPATVMPPLYDLTRQPEKPPEEKPLAGDFGGSGGLPAPLRRPFVHVDGGEHEQE